MAVKDLPRLIDHTLLRANARETEIRKLCDEANEFNFYSVCVNPRWIKFCVHTTHSLVATVVGFPLGANTLKSKTKECADAVEQGAHEIDMVLDLENVFSADWKAVETEIKSLVSVCNRNPLKVIIETAYLNAEQIRQVSKCCVFGGAAFVKTSTGFASVPSGPTGATVENVQLIRETVGPIMGIKASGGIKTLQDAERMVAAGATRLGCSASVEIVKEWKRGLS